MSHESEKQPAELIQLADYPVRLVLDRLLRDKTTKRNILFGADGDDEVGPQPMTPLLLGLDSRAIQPRVQKSLAQRVDRTRRRAEVFTPSWVCNKMNNHCDAEWFGREGVFNVEAGEGWTPTEGPVVFPKGRTWQKYVNSRRLEITCGEAPYIVSRYDTSTGEPIALGKRIGILDRKLRVVGENAGTEKEWLEWAYRAYESVYGYELQGDSLLIARINLLVSFVDYMRDRWGREPVKGELRRVTNIICWNFWQMDGMAGAASDEDAAAEGAGQFVFGFVEERPASCDESAVDCIIYDWRSRRPAPYRCVGGRGKTVKFDFVVGNPPYQEETENNGRQNPVYNKFMEETYKIADCVELITPARFLFNAGQTPKAWNEKMLNDEHFKVLHYEADAAKIFPTTDIKGGVAITLRNATKKYGAIKVFTAHQELNAIVMKVLTGHKDAQYLDSIISSRGCYRTTKLFFRDFPYASSRLGAGTGNMMASNFFEKIPEVCVSEKPDDGNDYIRILSRIDNKRAFCYIQRCYVQSNEYIDSFNVASPKSNGNGIFGEVLTSTEILSPNEGATDTFINIGSFQTLFEAESMQKYIKTKFLRTLLGIKKVTQDNPKSVWSLIPLQDFTPNSDIDWSLPVPEIDQQLYKKYGLSEEEINFIETHVKEMA